MTLGEAASSFLEHTRDKDSSIPPSRRSRENSLRLLTSCFTPNAAMSDVTPAALRDFLARWYFERVAESGRANSAPITGNPLINDAEASLARQLPEPTELLDTLAEFLEWTDLQEGTDRASQCSKMLTGLRRSLPRALAITGALSNSLREGGGAFGFPEFLTSFDEGGQSQYDVGAPGEAGAIEGYFRIIRVEGSFVEGEEMISGDTVWPIVFPAEVAALLDDGYIVNLELVRAPDGWRIAGCGFAYPPGTDT